jgi:hypothetical protein
MVVVLDDSLIIRFSKAVGILPVFIRFVRGSHVQSTLFGYPTHSTKYKSLFLDHFFPCIIATLYSSCPSTITAGGGGGCFRKEEVSAVYGDNHSVRLKALIKGTWET